MSEELSKFKDLLRKAKMYSLPEREVDIFSVGGRGHYENPITDILAFFCDTNAAHGLGSLVLGALVECLPEESKKNIGYNCTVLRERFTRTGKRIDLILDGNDWLIVLENKVFHHESNPFEEYEEWANDYVDNKKVPKENICFILLSPSTAKEKRGEWNRVSYRDLIEKMKSSLADYSISHPLTKWTVLLREFILHLEGVMYQPQVSSETTDFIFDNLTQINELQELKKKVENDFLLQLREALKEKLVRELGNEVFVNAVIADWQEKGICTYCYLPQRWEWDKNWGTSIHQVGLIRNKGVYEKLYVWATLFVGSEAGTPDAYITGLEGSTDDEVGRYFREYNEPIDSSLSFDDIVSNIAKRLIQLDRYDRENKPQINQE